MGLQYSGCRHCCCCYGASDDGGQYSGVSYYDTEAEEMIEIEATPRVQTADTSQHADADAYDAKSGEADDMDDDDGDAENSVEDPLYYEKYRIVSNPLLPDQRPPKDARPEDLQRYRYELAISAFSTTTDTKKVLIGEYEDFKSRYFNMEHIHTSESLLTQARRSQAVERKKELYRAAILHTTDLERKSAIKEEYNQFYRGLGTADNHTVT